MRIHIYFILIVVLLPFSADAGESPISLYRDNYFLFGNKDDQVKFQISVEYRIFNQFETDWARNLYVAYTQTSWWRVYKSADTMSNNYQPELFYRIEYNKNSFKDKDSEMIDYIQISPLYHCSTGTEGADHRGVNAYYAQIQASRGKIHNFGINLKLFGYWCKHENNLDINRYRDNYEL
jgi:outer membrane phospholipase A